MKKKNIKENQTITEAESAKTPKNAPTPTSDAAPVDRATTTSMAVGEGGSQGHWMGVRAGFPSCSMPLGGHPPAGLSAARGVAALRAATNSEFTMN